MKHSLYLLFIGILYASSLNAETTNEKGLSSQVQSTLIVTCNCNTQAEREKIQKEIIKAGGNILFTYESLGGFAVKKPKSGDMTTFEKKLRNIPGVKSVEHDGESGINNGN
ncbi:hypothetical protein KYI92_15100 [Pantoea allii]|uniref:Inhibitor I9 domain-containing protein n=1 Tax=Pantoea allii TaxID=574096 RepID=A0ABS6VGZ9_9GAMM|nr:hypothetical protein [Pantoea allii]MBW1215025.1 hypothetical protein [Pantoea allii]MBW1258608.1 hypothetical protein [Pantoea allii]MBW1267829.1 hypothetical protein [Pantoea allii]MBW1289700.1 hypothetical protein [Pantoea allii]